MYISCLIVELEEKQQRGNDSSQEGFSGIIQPSRSVEWKEYFVQKNTFYAFNKKGEIDPYDVFSCSCSYGYRKMYGWPVKRDECKHISAFRKQLESEENGGLIKGDNHVTQIGQFRDGRQLRLFP
jgi:hypothetical protein